MDLILNLENKRKSLEVEKLSLKNTFNITNIQFDLLNQLVDKLNSNNILEIGTSNGYSLLSIILAAAKKAQNQKVHINSVEVNEQRFKLAQDLIKNINLKNSNIGVNLINDNIYNGSCIKILKQSAPFDLIFIDCNQEEFQTLLHFIIQSELIKENTSLIFDNILSHEQSFTFYNSTDFRQLGFRATLFTIHHGFLHLVKI